MVVEKVISYIERHLYEKINIEDLSKEVGYSKYHLARMFRAKTGYTIVEYITRRKLSDAVLLLDQGYTIFESSYKVGFDNEKYFSRVFKRNFGIPPSRYKMGECFLKLTQTIEIGEGKIMNNINEIDLKVLLKECASTKEIIKVISTVDGVVIDEVRDEFISIIFVEKVNAIGKIVKHMRYTPMTQESVTYIIYNAEANDGVSIENLSIDEETICFEFHLGDKKSTANLKKIIDHKIQCSTFIKGEN